MATNYPDQLLALGWEAVAAARPNRAKLHRAISTGYYALFHLLAGDGAKLVRVAPELRRAVVRAFDHGTMRRVCNQVRAGRFPERIAEAYTDPIPDDLKRVAEVFVSSQMRRHEADYDAGRPAFTKAEVRNYLTAVRDAFADWRAVADHPAGRAFLVALLLHKDRG